MTATEFFKSRYDWIGARGGVFPDVQVHAHHRGYGVYLLIDTYYKDKGGAEAEVDFFRKMLNEVMETEGICDQSERD